MPLNVNEKLLDGKNFYLFFSLFFHFYLQGGEVVQETITSNIHDDIITLEFQRTDGTLITQLIDFRSVSMEVKVNLFLLRTHERNPFFPRADEGTSRDINLI